MMLSRRGLLGGAFGVLAGWLGIGKANGTPINGEVLETEVIADTVAPLNRREIYRKDPDGLTPISWEEQKPGDKILSCDWNDGKIIKMQTYCVVVDTQQSELRVVWSRNPERAVVHVITLTWPEFWADGEAAEAVGCNPITSGEVANG